MPIRVCTTYECFHATMVKSSSCHRNHMTYKTDDITICAYTESSPVPWTGWSITIPTFSFAKISLSSAIFTRGGIWANGGRQTSKHLPWLQRFSEGNFPLQKSHLWLRDEASVLAEPVTHWKCSYYKFHVNSSGYYGLEQLSLGVQDCFLNHSFN